MWKRNIALSILLVLVLPQLLFQIAQKYDRVNEIVASTEPSVTFSMNDTDILRTLRVKDHGMIVEMPLDDYVTGVVLGEMPADFEPEALKAQAVAARTFALRNVTQNSKHQDADVCTDATCCQAFVFLTDYTGDGNALNKVYTAVMDTTGQVITYNGDLIDAVYFSNSGGRTESAFAVWGSDVPYLQSVESPGEENEKDYEVTTFSYADFLKKLDLPADASFKDEDIAVTYTVGGGVNTFAIGNESYSGVQMRTLFNLRSTIFSIQIDEQNVRITTKGYGHRVGMSQYGAEAMAVNGSNYEEIIKHYYSGTDISKLSGEQIDAIFDKTENI